MKNQKISTALGTIVLSIIALTAGVFVLKIGEVPQKVAIQSKPVEKNQGQQSNNVYLCQKNGGCDAKSEAILQNWNICSNDEIGFKIKYPNDWSIYAKNGIDKKTDCNDTDLMFLPNNKSNSVSIEVQYIGNYTLNTEGTTTKNDGSYSSSYIAHGTKALLVQSHNVSQDIYGPFVYGAELPKLRASKPATDWTKTCINSSNNYKVKYPDEWSIQNASGGPGKYELKNCNNSNLVHFQPSDYGSIATGITIFTEDGVKETFKNIFKEATIDGHDAVWVNKNLVVINYKNKNYSIEIEDDVSEQLTNDFLSTFKFLK